MALFGDTYFFILAGVLLLPAIGLGLKEKNIKYYGFLITLVFVFLAMKDSPRGLVNLGAYCVFQFLLAQIYIRLVRRNGRNVWLYRGAVLLSIMPLAVWKVSAYEKHAVFQFIGLSYMTFKACQIIIEVYDGLIDEIKLFDFFYFLLFFPAISSGPIDRSRRFQEDLYHTPERKVYVEMVGDGLLKIFIGLFYKFILATGMYQAMIWLGKGQLFWNRLIHMYSYGFYLFFDFAGYSLMAIGTSYILGIRCPENFNKPFISTDMKDFWNRWHLTLSYWFRDFIFSRFMMKSIKKKWFKNKLTGASVGFIINMGIMGVWHGLDACYIGYGLYHGVLLALTEIYQKKCKYHRKHKKEKWYKAVSIFITFQLVMIGFAIFSGYAPKLFGFN